MDLVVQTRVRWQGRHLGWHPLQTSAPQQREDVLAHYYDLTTTGPIRFGSSEKSVSDLEPSGPSRPCPLGHRGLHLGPGKDFS
ncbi:hypothetical protein AVEN_273901-1 [Araneus ventricosus]|uniref:Uncharacterized protein n=1 Tax=Araneus ventricosus TaxID=182803 RepID=A0A4Y2D359_ARAVE|nr:hypothetical protein AVEN_273901-1 [Araneus ventricosus]